MFQISAILLGLQVRSPMYWIFILLFFLFLLKNPKQKNIEQVGKDSTTVFIYHFSGMLVSSYL